MSFGRGNAFGQRGGTAARADARQEHLLREAEARREVAEAAREGGQPRRSPWQRFVDRFRRA